MQKFNEKFEAFDEKYINWARRVALPFAKFSIFLIYFWFGFLKVLEVSPASPLVVALLGRTMSFIPADSFLIAFGLIEIIIAVLFLVPRFERLALFALALHLITTIMPLVLLPAFVWTGFMVPTLEGQYIIKNILLISAGLFIFSNLHTYQEKKKV